MQNMESFDDVRMRLIYNLSSEGGGELSYHFFLVNKDVNLLRGLF